MTGKLIIAGKIIKKYKIPKNNIDDLNKKYEGAKNHLMSYGPRLAGRIDSELDLLPIIQNTTIFNKLCDCLHNYIKAELKYGCSPVLNVFIKEEDISIGGKVPITTVITKDAIKGKGYNLNIIGCWVNDMMEGEYNPPHTHHNNTGYSVVLFLKIPKFINDAKDPHKFKDGMLGFFSREGEELIWAQPKVGDFYVFRADHVHCVMPFKTKKPNEVRRSMSFNFVLEPPKNKS